MSFSPYNTNDIVVASEQVVAPLWSGNLTNLTTFATSSTQENSNTGQSYLNVYNLPTNASGSDIQFSIVYGMVSGSGSTPFNSLVPGSTPTRAIYGEYRNLIWGDNFSGSFTFGASSFAQGNFYVISINRSRYKGGLQPGTLNLVLTSGSSTIQLTDNSNESNDTNFIGSNEFFTIVSGSNGISYNNTDVQTISGSYGLFFPSLSIIMLNASALALPYAQGGINLQIDNTPSTSYTNNYNTNNTALFNAVNAGASFSLQSSETVTSTWFFTRVMNGDFNYTTNPSVIDSNGNILFQTMINNSQTFPTTLGLYNSSNELLAVAKFSKPVLKDWVHEILVRAKLSF